MSKHGFLSWVQGFILAFIVGFSGVACLVTGLHLDVNLWLVAFWCMLTATMCSLLCGRRLGFVALGLFVLVIGYLWYKGRLVDSVESFLYYVSQAYHDAYGWNVVSWSGRSAFALQKTLPTMICLLGSLSTAVTAWSIAKGQSAAPAVLMALSAPLMCLMIPGSNPGMLWLWLLLYGIAMLLITSSTRYDDEKRGSQLMLFTAIPVALAVAILFAAIPKDAYTGQARAKAWSEALLSDSFLVEAWEKLTGQDQEENYGAEVRKVSLTSLGPRELTDDPVMTITSAHGGTLYLRSSAFDRYSGKTWTDSGDGAGLYWPDSLKLEDTGEVVISTRYAHAMLYLPYYVVSMNMIGVSRGIKNEKLLNYYSITCAPMPDQSYFEALYPDQTTSNHMISGDLGQQCTQLPDKTLKWAKPLADQLTKGLGNHYHKAQAIGNYVRNSARYTLNPQRMSSGEGDFVRWFLEESDTGYCVHFASSAAVLLKAAGIPARYVSGYMVTVEKGVPTAVREADAHAWVEYWLPGFGWTVLETTPAAVPETQIPGETGKEEGKTTFRLSVPTWIWTGLAIALPVGIIAQWQLRLRCKTRRLKKGEAKEKIISRYARLSALHELLKEPVDESVQQLAEKAKFSNHPMKDENVAILDSAIDAAKGKLRHHNLFKRIYYSLFLAQL